MTVTALPATVRTAAARTPAVVRAALAPPPTSVIDLDAFARGLDGVGRFLDVEGDAERVVAAAAGVADRLVLRHGAPRCGEEPGRRVVAGPAELRAVARAGTVSEPVGVLLQVALPSRRPTPGFDPYRPGFMEVLRTVVSSARLHFDGLYVAVDDADSMLRACRFGIELAAALQQLPGFTVGELYVSRTGRSGTPAPDADGLAEIARREIRLHSAALGAIAPLLRVDAGADTFPQCHTVLHRVVEVAAGAVRVDALRDDLPTAVLDGTARLCTRTSAAPDVPRAVTTGDGARTLGRVLLPADVAPGDRIALPIVGRTGLAAPSRYRLVGESSTGRRELLAALGVAAARAHPATG